MNNSTENRIILSINYLLLHLLEKIKDKNIENIINSYLEILKNEQDKENLEKYSDLLDFTKNLRKLKVPLINCSNLNTIETIESERRYLISEKREKESTKYVLPTNILQQKIGSFFQELISKENTINQIMEKTKTNNINFYEKKNNSTENNQFQSNNTIKINLNTEKIEETPIKFIEKKQINPNYNITYVPKNIEVVNQYNKNVHIIRNPSPYAHNPIINKGHIRNYSYNNIRIVEQNGILLNSNYNYSNNIRILK